MEDGVTIVIKMSQFNTLILNILNKYILVESEGKIDNFLNNQKNVEGMKQAIQNDPEVENKEMDPKELMMSWDKASPLLSKNIQWLGKQYINGQFFVGDIEKVNNDIQLFTSFGKRYPDLFSSSDLQQYTYSDLKNKTAQINPDDTTKMGTHQKKLYRQAGLEGVKEVYKDSDFTIYVPQTKAAAIALGTNTHWCTATTSSGNMFDTYNSQGPLYVLISNHNPDEKYQFHFESDQFMDVADDPIDLPEFCEKYPRITAYFSDKKDKMNKDNCQYWGFFKPEEISKKNIEAAIYYPRVLKYIKNPSYDIIMGALSVNGLGIQYLSNPDENMKRQAVKSNPHALQFIKNPSDVVKFTAIRRDGHTALRYIKNPTKEMEKAAFESNPRAIEYIKNPSEEMQLEAINRCPDCLKYIKNPTEEMQWLAIRREGTNIEYVPNPSEEMQLTAVRRDGTALRYIKNPSEKVQLEAVKRNGYAIEYVPNPSEELQLIAVKQDPDVIRILENPSEKVQLEAVSRDGTALYGLDNPSYQVQLTAVKQNGNAITGIKNPSEELQIAAVEGYPYGALDYLLDNEENVSDRVIATAIAGDPHNVLNLLDKKYRIKISDEVLLEAIDLNPNVTTHIKNPTNEMILETLKRKGRYIQHIPNPTEEMQMTAILNDNQAIQHIKNPTDKVLQKAYEVAKQNDDLYIINYLERGYPFIKKDTKQ